jgi:hypothetical protein
METLRIKLIVRINELFEEFNEKTSFKSKYWKDVEFLHDSNETAVKLGDLEEYFDNTVDDFTDDELIELVEFLAVESTLFDYNGYE